MLQNNSVLLPNTFSNVNLNIFVKELLISLTVARVTLIFDNHSTEIANNFLNCKEYSDIKWFTLNVDLPYMDYGKYQDNHYGKYQDNHLVILAFNTKRYIGLEMFELIWQLNWYRWEWHGKSNYLFVTENEIAEERTIHEILKMFREYSMYDARCAVMLRYSHSELVQICQLDNDQLKCFVYPETMWSSGTLHDNLYETDLFINLQGKSFRAFANLCAPQLFYGRLGDSVNENLENKFVGGTYVQLATMLGRYINANISFIVSDYLEHVKDEPRFLKYTLNEIEKVRKTDVILPSNKFSMEYVPTYR